MSWCAYWRRNLLSFFEDFGSASIYELVVSFDYLLELGHNMQPNLFTLFFQRLFSFRVGCYVDDIL